jgi:hypothetical protein
MTLLSLVGQCVEDQLELLLEENERGGVDWHDRVGVLDEVAETGVLLLAQGSLEGHGPLGDLEDLPDLVRRDPQLTSDLLRERLAPQTLGEVPVGPDKLVDEL